MKILIADDHPFTLQDTKSFVELYGYKVIDTCSNGISALNLSSLIVTLGQITAFSAISNIRL
ncbi:hypothetical protein [Flavobacterium sp.]|uniref:hypothetical protein n=1 Tax=Flavobacterium sp. TaxID=239 RepID=UPI003753DBBF